MSTRVCSSLQCGHWDYFNVCHHSYPRPFEAWRKGIHKGFSSHRCNNPEPPNGIYAGRARFNLSRCLHYGHRVPNCKWEHTMADNCYWRYLLARNVGWNDLHPPSSEWSRSKHQGWWSEWWDCSSTAFGFRGEVELLQQSPHRVGLLCCGNVPLWDKRHLMEPTSCDRGNISTAFFTEVTNQLSFFRHINLITFGALT